MATAWIEKKTMDGVVYYYNTESKDVSWDPPNASDDGANEEWTWVPHAEDVWQPGRIVSRDEEGTHIQLENEQVMIIPKSGVVKNEFSNHKEQKVLFWPLKKSELLHLEDDLIMLENVNDGSIIHNLEERYKKTSLYTWVGASHRVLVAVNPYKRLPLYGDDIIKQHREKSPNIEVPPHIYDIANDSYDEMLFDGKHQSILISGESGAGKTEATKQCLRFWAKVAGSKNGVEERLIQANPVLEAFGNAKTIRNNNSSRFGKWQEVYFDQIERSIDGAIIINYLLEKSRLVYQQSGERNFHIFYQLLSDASTKAAYELPDVTANRYTQKGLTGSVGGIDDSADFADAKKAMVDLFFSEQEQEWLLRIPAAILHLGNVTFLPEAKANNVRGSKVENESSLNLAAKFLDVGAGELKKVLVSRTIVVKGERSVIPLDAEQARSGCDSISKGIYTKLFDWLVSRCNKALNGDTSGKFIGVLDIFGFEIFDVNSFEQLCINYCNEKLQQLFNIETFRDEEAVYSSENIPFSHIHFIDSDPVLQMIEKGPHGILPCLDDECLVPEGNDQKFMLKIEEHFKTHKNFATDKHRKLNNILAFEIVHYAGTVKYTADEFMVKNRDQFYQDAYDLGQSSKHALTKALFPDLANRVQIKSLSSVFRAQLSDLMVKLQTTSTRYVRCLKPNDSMSPLLFEAALVLRQLRYSGVFEAVAIRKQGYPFRYKYEAFSFRYRAINPDYDYKNAGDNPKALCKEILDNARSDFSGCVFGNTMVFYRAEQYKKLKLLRNLALETIIPRVQGILRGATARTMYFRLKGVEDKLDKAFATQTDIALMKKTLGETKDVLGSLHARMFSQYHPRNEQKVKDQVELLELWVAMEKKMQDVVGKDPNKNFLAYLNAKEEAEKLQHIPMTAAQKELFDKICDSIINCEVGKLDAQCQAARREMNKEKMEELLAKSKEWGHQSPSVDEILRVLGLAEVDFVELEAIAAKEMGDDARFVACKSKLWGLRGAEERCVQARKTMNRAEMEELAKGAKDFGYTSENIQEIVRVLALSEKEYLKLEVIAAQEMGDGKREKKCNMRLWEIEMNELPQSYSRWQSWGGFRTGEDYSKGKWFGKSACRDGMLLADKAVVNNSLTKNEDPNFKKMAKDINKGILAYVGLKSDPRGAEAAILESFSIAGRSSETKNELYCQLIKAATPNLPKIDGATHQKAVDLLAVCLYLWNAPDAELEKFVYVFMAKRGKKYVKAAVHGRFDSTSSQNLRSVSDVTRIINEVNAMDGEGGGNAVALT